MRQLIHTCIDTLAVWLMLHVGHLMASTNSLELNGLSWLSIELLQGKVNTDSRNCFIISTFIHPKIVLMLEDADSNVQTRTVTYNVETEGAPTPSGTNPSNLPSWPVLSTEPFVTYYGRNASLMTELVGHDSRFKEPLKTIEILANSSKVALPLNQTYMVLKMGAECYNITVAIRELSFLDLVPTTTADPSVIARGAQFVYDASKMSSNTASLPFWSVALVSALLLVFIIAFVVLLFVHLQSKRRISKMTIQHETSGCMAKKQKSYHHNNNNNNHNNNHHLKPPTSCSSSSSNGIIRSSSIESHYDVPWEHKFRPLPDWLRTDLATALTDGAPKTVPVKPVPAPRGMGTADSGVESLSS